jgi:hypothetical protein
MERPSWLT